MSDNGHRIPVAGALTLDGASSVLQAGSAALAALPGDSNIVIDLAQVTAVDSSGLAVVFAWLRAAGQRRVTFAQVPPQLLSLAAVYGVGDILPLA